MTTKSKKNRRPTATKNTRRPTIERYDEDDEALEDALAFEHGFYRDEDESERGYLARASARIREATHHREGQIVVAALAGGFALGVLIGGVIASSRGRRSLWTERIPGQELGRRLVDRIGSAIPETITERFSRS